eukprot:TRINITY_DN1063_c0_g1_i2.p1 TRINITY_DN1063_c0_g1~~TRINITY_DN1063_c0_g1_i2.p1  ORF type:complete len:125 (-),score=33.73 TRINITY_DN1063_c0_g1_i2:142-516(-)
MDPELEELRQKRLQQLRAQGGGEVGNKNPKEEEAKRAAEAERRTMILAQVLEPAARERLNRIALVKPEKARSVEDMIINAAQTGRLGAKVDEQKLIQLLEDISEQTKQTKVTFQRKNRLDDDDY